MAEEWVWDEIDHYRLDKEIIVKFLMETFPGQDTEGDFSVYVGASTELRDQHTD